mmetsp:Transcript_32633/g.84268  ORF Transcript_32633/g.84268 Transcript_32633/m.84268 type:complete len:236 (-) Transcript_32633:14-721(-)
MVGSRIDDTPRHPVSAVVDGDSPSIHKDEHEHVEIFVHGEEVDVKVIRKALGETVNRMKGMRRKGTRHFPQVMGLVEVVERRMMKKSVHPVHAHISKKKEGYGRQENPTPTMKLIVQLAVSEHFPNEQGRGSTRHDQQGRRRQLDFPSYLIWKKFGVVGVRLIPNKNVVQRGKEKVEEEGTNRGDQVHRYVDTVQVFPLHIHHWPVLANVFVGRVEEVLISIIQSVIHAVVFPRK